MPEQNVMLLRKAMQKRFGNQSVLGGLEGETPTAPPTLTPGADTTLAQEGQEPSLPPTLPDQQVQEIGNLGEEKSNASIIVEGMANLLKKLRL